MGPPGSGASATSLPRAAVSVVESRRGGESVIYLIFKDGEVLVETDNLEFVRRWLSTDGECTVRDARTGKKIAVESGA
jgi:hypothetical protein